MLGGCRCEEHKAQSRDDVESVIGLMRGNALTDGTGDVENSSEIAPLRPALHLEYDQKLACNTVAVLLNIVTMPAPTALLRRSEELAEASAVPLPSDGETRRSSSKAFAQTDLAQMVTKTKCL